MNPGLLPPNGLEIAFVLVGLAVLASAVAAVTVRHLVHAVLWLVVALGGLAVEYLLLTAEFVAWVQILVYVGAVVALLLFGLMLTRAPIGPSAELAAPRWLPALLVAVASAAGGAWVAWDAFAGAYADLTRPGGLTGQVGSALFRGWALPFEALSVLLLAALIGAVVLTKRSRGSAPAGERPDREA